MRKNYLLFNLFYNHLLSVGIDKDHIIKLALDDRKNKKYRDPDVLCEYIHNLTFEDALNSFLHIENADTFVTGSNAKFLSKDIITEFRGRGFKFTSRLYPTVNSCLHLTEHLNRGENHTVLADSLKFLILQQMLTKLTI